MIFLKKKYLVLNQFFKWTYKKPKMASRKRHVYGRVKQFIEIINVNFFKSIYPTVLKKYFIQVKIQILILI